MMLHHRNLGWIEAEKTFSNNWRIGFADLLGDGAKVEMWSSDSGEKIINIKVSWPGINKEVKFAMSYLEIESMRFSDEILAIMLAKRINELLDEAKMIDRLNELTKEFDNELKPIDG